MREKRYIRLRTDMYEDTKFKIIDTMEKRDTINYIWTRLLALCGKINEPLGYLFVTKNVPYTIEVLAIEFNRSKKDIEDAIKVFIDLKMLSKENGVFRICNWNKHQTSSKHNKNNEEIKKLEVKDEEESVKKSDNIEDSNIKEEIIEKVVSKNNDDKEIKHDKKEETKSLSTNSISKGQILEFSEKPKTKSKENIKKKKNRGKSSSDNDIHGVDEEEIIYVDGFDVDSRYKGELVARFDFT